MRQAWRWFGQNDPVTLDVIRQAGATDIVSSLHHIPPGEAWSLKDVEHHRNLIEDTPAGRVPLSWSVIESIPVADDIKRKGADAKQSIAAWIASLEAAAQGGLKIICYNFMPVVDWTRTDLDWPLPTGATALRFDQDAFAAFDLYILKRPGAESSYDPDARARAKAVADAMDDDAVDRLTRNIAAGLPGSTTDALSLDAFRDKLEAYKGIDAPKLRKHLIEFLEQVVPVADRLSVKLTLHPDDPPRPLFGLPRVASTEDDYAALFDAVPSEANGMCFCTGSLGVRSDNNLPAMARRFASRVHFAHLRATRREQDGLSFYEADHLAGDVDMVAVIDVLLKEDRRRNDGEKIPFRPDHGHRMLDDLSSARRVNPGYTAIGRLKGLAELRGVIKALEARSSLAEAH
jgi:mannonate dehydratase